MAKGTCHRLARKSLRMATTAAVMAALFAMPAGANVGEDMASYFDDMGAAANASGPVAYQGQSSGYYTLGSMWARFPQKTVTPANLQLPRVRAGCGGIDIFTGSFSFINAAEFVAMLKAVANNAVGFAFKLAIDSISPQIGGVIDQMQDIANKVNQFNIGSCEAAAAAVGTIWPRVDAAEDRICQSIGQSAGQFADAVKARRGCGNGGERASTLAGAADPALKDQIPGPKNYGWDLIRSSPLGEESRELQEFVMTLTGTIVVGRRTSDDAPLPVAYRGPGDPALLDALLDGARGVTILRCADGTTCLELGDQSLAPLGSNALRPRIRAMIESMADKVRSDQALSPAEISLLGVASAPLYKIMAVTNARNIRLAASEMDALAEVTAIDMLNAIVQRMLDQVAAGLGGNARNADAEHLERFARQLTDVRRRMAERESSVSQKVNRTYEIVERVVQIESTLQNEMSAGMAASLSFSRALSAQGVRP